MLTRPSDAIGNAVQPILGGDRWDGAGMVCERAENVGKGRVVDAKVVERISAAGFLLEHVTQTGSTNSDLIAAGHAGAASGSVLVADRQNAGRGRRERSWQAPAGSSLLCSILLRPAFCLSQARLLPAAAALSLQEAIAEIDVACELKWPNDLMIGSRKLAGVLSEIVTTDAQWFAVVGVGCNVAWRDVGGADIGSDLSARVVSIDEFAEVPDLWQLLVRYVEILGERLTHIDVVSGEYRNRCSTVVAPVLAICA